MPALKPGTILPTDEEDAIITAAALADPDAQPLTEEEWEAIRPRLRVGCSPSRLSVTAPSGRQFLLATEEEEARIRAGIAADPDTYELTDEEMAQLRPLAEFKRGRPRSDACKVSTTIRFDADLLDVMKALGPGWQTRANDALRERFMGELTRNP